MDPHTAKAIYLAATLACVFIAVPVLMWALSPPARKRNRYRR